MKLSKKLLVSILTTASLFGVSLASQNHTQANASMRHYTRYINGNYNAYHNVPGKRNAYLMHYGHNYRNDRVSTYGTYYKFGRHYTKINRARRWFGYMNVRGLNTRPLRIQVRRHAYRRPIRSYRRARRHATTGTGIPHVTIQEMLSTNPKVERRVNKIVNAYNRAHPKTHTKVQHKANHKGKQRYLKLAEQDTIKGLNKIREAKGIQPLTPDPELQHVAEQRLGQEKLQDPNNPHIDKYTGVGLADEDEQNDGYTDLVNASDKGENYSGVGEYWLTNPKEIAHDENISWDSAHNHTRESPDFNRIGLAIDSTGKTVEDFAG